MLPDLVKVYSPSVSSWPPCVSEDVPDDEPEDVSLTVRVSVPVDAVDPAVVVVFASVAVIVWVSVPESVTVDVSVSVPVVLSEPEFVDVWADNGTPVLPESKPKIVLLSDAVTAGVRVDDVDFWPLVAVLFPCSSASVVFCWSDSVTVDETVSVLPCCSASVPEDVPCVLPLVCPETV